MTDSLSSDRDFRLWVLLSQAKDTVFKAREKELRGYAISPEESGVLFILQTLGGEATPNEIARWLLRRHHTVLGILSRMAKKGLLNKTKDLARKNLIRVTLTEKGKQAHYQSTKLESIHRIMSSLSEEEVQQLNSCLDVLRDTALKELGMDRRPPFPQA